MSSDTSERDDVDDAEDYRRAARAWLVDHVPGPEALAGADELTVSRSFQAALHDAGYAGITWPRADGGQGLGQAEQQVFAEEAARFELPVRPFQVGIGMCGPTLVELGTPAQRARHLRPLLRGEEVWCQLFSEPEAGSDVAGLQTRAVPDGDDWLVSGQKVWTSVAQWADFGALLARTDPDAPKHDGITMFIVDMRAPGLTVRPLVDMTGGSTFNEVFLDDVRLSTDDVIGAVGGGWRAAVTMLGHERVSIGGLRQKRNAGVTFAALAARARARGTDEDPRVRDALAGLWADEQALALYNGRLAQESAAGRPPGARGSVAKLAAARLVRRAVATAGLVDPADVVARERDDGAGDELELGILSAPASSIAGGTNEIQRSIIGERILGLPREPRPATEKERRGPAAQR